MTRHDAIAFAKENYGYNGKDDYCAIVKLRHNAETFPEYGVNGENRDECEWMYLDMSEKVDTGHYGCIYYFGERDFSVKDSLLKEIDKLSGKATSIGDIEFLLKMKLAAEKEAKS